MPEENGSGLIEQVLILRGTESSSARVTYATGERVVLRVFNMVRSLNMCGVKIVINASPLAKPHVFANCPGKNIAER